MAGDVEVVAVTEGRLSPGLPYLRLGHGPPLVMASGLTPRHANPTGIGRRTSLSTAAPFARHFTVYVTNRKVGLAPGSTMSDIAGDYAAAIEHDFGEPVGLHGTSTGGSVALQLAIDHPHLVRRLVLAASACRLSPRGRQVQADLARLTRDGDLRRAWTPLAEAVAPRLLRYPVRALTWLVGPSMSAHDPSDMLVTIAAEDAFDAEPDLGRVQAPTLVLGGSADPFYSQHLFRRTAAGVPTGGPWAPPQGAPVRRRLGGLGEHQPGLPARRMTQGATEADTMRRLAQDGGAQEGAVSVMHGVVSRLGHVAPVALLIAAGYALVLVVAGFLAPVYESTSASSSGAVTHGSGTLVGVNGLGVVVVLAVPLLVTLAVGGALLQRPRRHAAPVAWTLTALLAVFNLLAMMSIGVFVLPVTAALVLACGTCRPRPRQQDAGAHPAVAG